MHRATWLAVSALVITLSSSDAATGQPKVVAPAPAAPFTATVRVLEIATSVEARAVIDRFDVTKRLVWRTAADDAVYQGTPESILKLKLRVEGAQAAADLMGVLVRASEEDPALGRPPMISVALPSVTYRGVVESLSTRCDPKQCEAELVVLQAQRALARTPVAEDPARSPGF